MGEQGDTTCAGGTKADEREGRKGQELAPHTQNESHQTPKGKGKGAAKNTTAPVCRDYQNEKCTRADCRFLHACSNCGKSHPASKCLEKKN